MFDYPPTKAYLCEVNALIMMTLSHITAAEAAAMIKDGDNLALSGFTPNGNPKAIFRELSQRAIREHEAGNPFAIGIFTGASS